MIDQEVPRTIEIEIIPTIGIETTQTIQINNIKINHAIVHKIEI